MRVIVTRPAPQATAWVQSLEQQGIAAVALPLIEIAPPADAAVVTAAWQQLATRQLVVFASPNAAEQFFVRRPADAPWPGQVLAATVGPGTTDALKRHGVPPACIVEPAPDAPQFDSQSLWRQLDARDWRGASVLVVRGDGGRDWLADTLRGGGAHVDFVAAYRRAAPRLDEAGGRLIDAALAQPVDHLWFFSSSESLGNLGALRPGAHWGASSALATHPRIAQRARDCGFGVIHTARPTLDAVVACIQSIAS